MISKIYTTQTYVYAWDYRFYMVLDKQPVYNNLIGLWTLANDCTITR